MSGEHAPGDDQKVVVRISLSEYRRLRRLAEIANEFADITICPECKLPKPDGYVCACGYGR